MKKIYLVSCVESKQTYSAMARDLYTSVWFRSARRFVESLDAEWFVLSAQYGLLSPEKIVETYETNINRMTVGERQLWAKEIVQQIGRYVHPQQKLVFLAGANYCEPLVPLLKEKGFGCATPLVRLEIDDQISWLRKHCRSLVEPIKIVL